QQKGLTELDRHIGAVKL
ncbi:uncharacterized, partial [Tachysurus ichikawai]